MKKIVIISLLLFTFVFAKQEDYSEMSNQELIAIIGYVKEDNKAKFIKELNSRIPTMTEAEKAQ
jgi:hydrogenase-4 membrane subunit HyfE